ncbi:MAG: hypothetical protein Q8P97_01555 [bacterium]|nr:hypothetical protein [bacterium]
MSFKNDLITMIGSYSRGYRLMRRYAYRNYYDLPDFRDLVSKHHVQRDTLKTTVYRLKKQGLIQERNSTWYLSKRGKDILFHLLKKKEYKDLSKRNKNMIISFDIPQLLHKKRFWLRRQLFLLGFSPIQKSVWFGPAPLPRSFIAELHELHLLPCLKFFKANEEDIT